MKRITAVIPLMVCLAFSVALLSCGGGQETTGLETESGSTIQGIVQIWRDQSAAAGIKVQLKSAYGETTCVTDSTGSYFFTGLEKHVYKVIPIGKYGVDYYFIPESRDIVLSGEDITVSRFSAIRYPEVTLKNNGPWMVVGVTAITKYTPDTTDFMDNLLSKDLEPFTGSGEILIQSGLWIMVVSYLEGTKELINVSSVNISPEQSLVLPLNSILKVENNGSITITSVETIRCLGMAVRGEWGDYTYWSENLLTREVPPGTVSEDIYVWPGCREVILVYPIGSPEDSLNSYVMHTDVNFSPGDTVYLTFER